MAIAPTDFTPEDALVAIMIAQSASDETMRTSELLTIERIINHLPAFRAFDTNRLTDISNSVLDLFADEDGLEAFWDAVRAALPAHLLETAYALACDVAAADGKLPEPQLRFLEEIRYELDLDRLHTAAIERATRARHMGV